MRAKIKLIIFLFQPHRLLGWLTRPLRMISGTLDLSRWMAGQTRDKSFNDFPRWQTDYQRRYRLYEYLCREYDLGKIPITYLEFGVAEGHSFNWWLKRNQHKHSLFYGFDTFEGLPESWGKFQKGSMSYGLPVINSDRVELLKGLFQENLPEFLMESCLSGQLVIHMDADLFSSTLFVLMSLLPYLKKGDVLIFDEFNVPDHEFRAWKIFTEATYIKMDLIAAVNNYHQVAFMIK
jgi:O-methyltransferase